MKTNWKILLILLAVFNINCVSITENIVNGDWLVFDGGDVLMVVNSSSSGFELASPTIEGYRKSSFVVEGHWGIDTFLITPISKKETQSQTAKIDKNGYVINIDIKGKQIVKHIEKVDKKNLPIAVLSNKYKTVITKYPKIQVVGESSSFYIVKFPEPSEGILYIGALKEL